ncbi:MAG TPA: Hpt domain-containing protein [Burkholderiales bacterium]|nr:Hpt domain-containing protein [Burkholderiales bacterium]
MPVSKDEFDIGPLSWVKPEIELALRRADEGIRRFSVNPGDQEIARSTLAHLHQVSGALLMVGLEPVARVSEAVEKLIELLGRGELNVSPEAMSAARGVISALSQYLEGLMRGDPNRPLALFPVYKNVLAASGVGNASEVDLFYPDLSRKPKFGDSATARVSSAEVSALLALKRTEFQRGLLNILRGKDIPQSFLLMRNALVTIEATQTGNARTLWWLAVGFLEGLASSPTPPSAFQKQLCGRIDQQIKRQSEGGDEVSERLIRELLFAVAITEPAVGRVREIQDAYRLRDLIPPAPNKDSPEDTRAKHAIRELKDQLEQIKETWLKFTSGNRASLTQFAEETTRLRTLAQNFHNEALQSVFAKLGDVASDLSANPREPGEVLALETATALLMAKDAVENYARLGPNFKSLAETCVVRVAAALKGQSMPAEGASQLADISRAAQEKILFFQLGQEILTNLNHIEQALDTFFRDPSKRSDLASLPASINQVLGALSMLESEDAVNLLKASRDLVQKFASSNGPVDMHDAELTAEAFSNLGLFVAALQQGRENPDELLHSVLARFNIAPTRPVAPPEPEPEEEIPPPVVARDFEVDKRQLAELYDRWQRESHDPTHRTALSEALLVFGREANLAGHGDLAAQASVARSLVSESTNQPTGAVREAFGAILGASLPPEPAPAKPVGVVEPAPVEIDAELLEIFLEEAIEVLGGIAIHHDVIAANPSDREAQTVIRRGFHTLKGSGRMVGLTELGEVAWQVEQVMNKWLRDEKPISKGLLRLISETHHAYVGWIEILKSGGNPIVHAPGIFKLADQLKNDQEPDEVTSMSAAEEPTSAPVQAEVAVEQESIPETPATEPVVEMATEPAGVVIGDVVLDPEFFEIFANEANTHTETLRKQLDNLRDDPAQTVAYDFMRAAHTLTGICRTSGFTTIAELGFIFEKWLLDRLEHPAPFTEGDLSLTEKAVEVLSQMVFSVLERRVPSTETGLVAHLNTRLQEARAERRELEAKAALEAEAEAFGLPTLQAPANVVEPTAPAEVEAPHPVESTQSVEAELSLPDDAEWAPPVESEATQPVEEEPPQISEAELLQFTDTELMRPSGIEMPPSESPVEVAEAAFAELIEAESVEPEVLPPAEIKMSPSEGQLEVAETAFAESPEVELIEPAPEPYLPTTTYASAPSAAKPAATPETTAVAKPVDDTEAHVESGKERRVIVDDVDEQLLPIFLEEALELLPEVGDCIRTWRAAPPNKAPATLLGRHLHTLKGSARMAGVMRLGELAHVLENRVVEMQGQAHPADSDYEALEDGFDRFNMALERLKGGERGNIFPTHVAKPAEPTEVVASSEVDLTATAAVAVPQPVAALRQAAGAPVPVQSEEADRRAVLRVRADFIDRFVNDAGEISIARSRIEGEMNAFRQGLAELNENVGKLRAQVREVEIQAESQIQSSIQHKQQEMGDTFDPLEFDRFTRMQELTRFMAESLHDFSTLQLSLTNNLDEVDAALAAQSRLNRDLQQDLMSVRMVPLGNLSDRLYRVVRQTAKELGKKANLELKGMRTELDRSVLEQIVAPFEHLLRNALSHGIEMPEKREAAGKSQTGEITIDARQQANEIVLTFTDDGAGINVARVREKAIEQGLMSPDDHPDDKHTIEYIFMPGFSTAAEVTQIAGRGVGMDVVKSAIVTLGGRIEIDTAAGQGTKFIITLPLTLAVTQVLLIRANGTLFGIPSALVEQVQQWKLADIEKLRQNKEIVWRNNHYPFDLLTHLLGEEEKVGEPRRYFPVLLLRSGAHRAAVEIDSIEGNREIVVKSIGPQMSRLLGIAGATVLGNGQVVLILNPVLLGGRQEGPTVEALEPKREAIITKTPIVMVVDDSLTVRKITSRLLLREGYQVVTAKDGVDALQQLQEVTPDVMLLDIEMPRMDGFELTRNLRADSVTARIPIIMITSRTAEKHRNFALELGVNEYLGKPFQEDELLGHIARFCGKAVPAH